MTDLVVKFKWFEDEPTRMESKSQVPSGDYDRHLTGTYVSGDQKYWAMADSNPSLLSVVIKLPRIRSWRKITVQIRLLSTVRASMAVDNFFAVKGASHFTMKLILLRWSSARIMYHPVGPSCGFWNQFHDSKRDGRRCDAGSSGVRWVSGLVNLSVSSIQSLTRCRSPIESWNGSLQTVCLPSIPTRWSQWRHVQGIKFERSLHCCCIHFGSFSTGHGDSVSL